MVICHYPHPSELFVPSVLIFINKWMNVTKDFSSTIHAMIVISRFLWFYCALDLLQKSDSIRCLGSTRRWEYLSDMLVCLHLESESGQSSKRKSSLLPRKLLAERGDHGCWYSENGVFS